MGLSALAPEVATSTDLARMTGTASIGASVGSVFAAAALVYALGYLDLLGATPEDYDELRATLISASSALLVVFAATILFEISNFIA